MASINSILSPPPQLSAAGGSQLSAKRKRAESADPPQESNSIGDSNITNSSQLPSQDSPQQIVDLVEVLKSHDISPSILNYQLPIQESSVEPQPKRKKAVSGPETFTIIGRTTSGSYLKLENVISDIKAACSAILDKLDLPSGAARTQYTPISPTISELAAKVKAFRSTAEHILEGERAHDARKLAARLESGGDGARPLVNGNMSTKTVTQLSTSPGDNKSVLTLFGNAPGPKQLFSSLQQPVKAEDGTTEVMQTLREAGLPNGITTTQVVPLKASGLVDEKKKVPTIGELFAQSISTLPFQPPKPSQIASTRGSVVGWWKPTELETVRSRNSQSYFGQSITTGEWLDYAGSSSIPDPKRRQRERALSLGGGKMPSTTENTAEKETSKLEALFRSAYSSFAPTKDDAAAIVPQGLASRIWWQRLGERSFERLVKNTVNLEMSIVGGIGAKTEQSDEDKAILTDPDHLESIIEEWDDQAIDPNLEGQQDMPRSIQDKDVEEILQDISELLETLNSYQRIRNVSINSLHRAGGANVATDPARPTDSEIATYNTLKAQLTLMITMLPPYAVAKLNSDQLAELNISTKIAIYTDNHKGVMEEDEAAARAKVAEMRAASSTRPTPATTLNRSSSLYGNQYSSSIRTSTPTGQQQYYSQAQTPVRQPSVGLPRQPATAPSPYPGQRPPSATSLRPQNNYATPTYPHQLPRTSQSQYGQSSSQQYYQSSQSANYGQSGNQGFTNTQTSNLQTSLNSRYQTQTQSAFQSNRVPASTPDYRYSNGVNATRQTSPQKPQAYSPQPQAAQPLSRPYGLAATSTPQDLRYFQQGTSNGTSALSPQPQASQSQNGNLGVTGYHTVMTAEQQSNMMERQRAQLAQQQGTQQHARSVAQAGTVSTSPAPQVNGGSAVTAGH